MSNTNTNSRDRLVSIAKGAASALPIVGGAIAEALDSVVPNLRFERVVIYLKEVEKRVTKLESGITNFELKLKSEEGLDIFEESIIQASRAVSEDRKIRVANLTAKALSSEELKYQEAKKLLNIFKELTDPEVIWLIYYSLNPHMGKGPHLEFRNKHPEVLNRVSRVTGAPKNERDKGALQDSYRNTLNKLGLLTDNDRSPVITPLGRLLLEYIEG